MPTYLVRNKTANKVNLMLAAAKDPLTLWNVIDEVMDPNVCEFTEVDFGLFSIEAHMTEVPSPEVDHLKADSTGLLTEAAHFNDEGQTWQPLFNFCPYQDAEALP